MNTRSDDGHIRAPGATARRAHARQEDYVGAEAAGRVIARTELVSSNPHLRPELHCYDAEGNLLQIVSPPEPPPTEDEDAL